MVGTLLQEMIEIKRKETKYKRSEMAVVVKNWDLEVKSNLVLVYPIIRRTTVLPLLQQCVNKNNGAIIKTYI